jgi:hypothetical protein
MVRAAWSERILGGRFCHSQSRMARRHGRSHFKDQLLAAHVAHGRTRQAMAKAATAGATAASLLEIFEEFPQANASIRFNKSFLLVTPVI